MKKVMGWFGRHLIVYVMLVVVILVGPIAWQKWVEPKNTANEIQRLEQARDTVVQLSEGARRSLAESKSKLGRLSNRTDQAAKAELRSWREQAEADLAKVNAQLAAKESVFSRIDPARIVARKKLEIEKQRLELEVAGVKRAAAIQDKGFDADEAFKQMTSKGALTKESVQILAGRCTSAKANMTRFEKRWTADQWIRETVRNERQKLQDKMSSACVKAERERNRRGHWLQLKRKIERLDSEKKNLRTKSYSKFQSVTGDIDAAIAERKAIIEGSWRTVLTQKMRDWHLADVAIKAGLALAAIVATPFLIRLFFFLILAPIAERRSAIRIAVPGNEQAPIPSSPPSRVSIPVRLNANEELLVRQDYLQTTSLVGRFATKWMIDWRSPLSSFASGLVFLTRIRGDGETTTVSAIRDPFAELTEVTMPVGSACVLHARSLVAVVQPIGRHIRITRHWRLFSLNAWLTLQLRYLVFHGPGRLIVMGGRGIRVEQAQRGRVFGQNQLVGFSADLSYSVTRTKTFWPYFLGRESLFKDKVRDGNGILIIEEAPLSARKGSGVKHGLEGAFDAMLKMVGL